MPWLEEYEAFHAANRGKPGTKYLMHTVTGIYSGGFGDRCAAMIEQHAHIMPARALARRLGRMADAGERRGRCAAIGSLHVRAARPESWAACTAPRRPRLPTAPAPGSPRLRGMLYALRAAAAMKRVVLFQWSYPHALSNFFEPAGRIDWRPDGLQLPEAGLSLRGIDGPVTELESGALLNNTTPMIKLTVGPKGGGKPGGESGEWSAACGRLASRHVPNLCVPPPPRRALPNPCGRAGQPVPSRPHQHAARTAATCANLPRRRCADEPHHGLGLRGLRQHHSMGR